MAPNYDGREQNERGTPALRPDLRRRNISDFLDAWPSVFTVPFYVGHDRTCRTLETEFDMKYSLKLCSVLLFGMASASAQNTFLIHFDSIQDGRGGRGLSVVEVADGYLLFTEQVSTDTTISPRNHLYIRKVSLNGTLSWSSEVNSGQDRDYNFTGYGIDPVCRTHTGNYASCVTDYDHNTLHPSLNEQMPRLSLYLFNELGDTISTKKLVQFSTIDSVSLAGLQTIQTEDSGFAIAGWLASPANPSRAFLLRTNGSGDTLWFRTYDMTFEAVGIVENYDGGFLLTGRNTSTYNKFFLIRTDSAGNFVWRRHFGAYPGGTQQVRLAADGNILTWARNNTIHNPGVYDTVPSRLSCWSQNNALLWYTDIHSTGQPTTYDFEVLADGSVITVGTWGVLARFIKFGPQGDSLWATYYRILGGFNNMYDVEPTSDGGFIATGECYQTSAHGDPTPGLYTIIVAKLDSMGCVVPGCQSVGVQEILLGLEDALQVFPNPSAGLFTADLALPAQVQLTGTLHAVVVDAMGREVYRQGHGTQLQQRFTVDLSGNPPGLYYLHITDGQRALTGAKLMKE